MSGALVLPLFAMTVYLIYSGAREAEAQERAVVLAAARDGAEVLDAELAQMRDLLGAIASRPLVRALDPARCDPLLKELSSVDSRFANIGLRTRAGEALCLQQSAGLSTPAQIREAEWFQEAVEAEEFQASNAFRARTLGRWVVVLSQPVSDRSGAPAAVLAAAVPVERFAELIGRGGEIESAVSLLVDRAGTLLYRSLDNPEWQGKKALGADLLDKLPAGRQGNYRARGLDGVERLYAFAAVTPSGWKVIVGRPAAAVSQRAQHQMLVSLLLWGLLTLLATALAFGVGRAVSGPIRQLGTLVRAAGEGYFHFPIQPRGPAEVARLAEEFNRMLAQRRGAESELKSALKTRVLQHDRLEALTRRVTTLREKQSRDLARELHDRVGQNLSSLSINLERLRGESTGRESAARIADCVAVVEATGLIIQDVLTELKPPMLINYGLLDALRFHAREFSRRSGVAVEVSGPERAGPLGAEIELALFRIAQAALNNVAQHARAKSARISLEHSGGRTRFCIRDDGAGFDVASAVASGRWGLGGIRERAEAIDGVLRIDSAPGRGAELVVELDAGP